MASPHLSPPSHPLGWAPGARMADASTSEAFLILEVSGRSLTPGTEWGWEALVGWAAHGHLFDARSPGPRARWHLSWPGCRARWSSHGQWSQEREPHCCMKAHGDCPLPHAWDRGVQSKAGLGWTCAGCGAQRTAACPPSVSLGPHLSPLQPPPWGPRDQWQGPERVCVGDWMPSQ